GQMQPLPRGKRTQASRSPKRTSAALHSGACYIGFWEPKEELNTYPGIRKQLCHPAVRQDAGGRDVLRPPIWQFFLRSSQEPGAEPFWIEPIERDARVRFDRKPRRGRLHPIRLAKSDYFAGELLLLLLRTHVFDDAVAKHEVEGTIGKLMDVTRVAFDVPKRVDARPGARNGVKGGDSAWEVQDSDIEGYRHEF